MTALVPCPACKRHVATRERACPFCAQALPVARPQNVTVIGRVTRAAVFSAALAACGKDKPKDTPAPPPAHGSDDLEKMLDNDGKTVEHAPAPPADAAVVEPDAAVVDAGVPPDAGVVKKKKPHHEQAVPLPPPHNIPKPYGAPPARRRIV